VFRRDRAQKGTETMHRLFLVLAALGLASGTLGCHHTHGACDCEPTPNAHWVPPPFVPAAAPVLKPEPVQTMPKAE
jgi:hypothetical protein